MNTQVAKNIRKYVRIKLKEEGLPDSEEKRLYKVFKTTYERANPETQKRYDQDMKNAFEKQKKEPVTPAT